MISGRVSPLLCVQQKEMGLCHGNNNHSRENQHNTSSGPPNWQRQNARGTSALRDPEEGLER
ncbi:hypothetical protein E2C01_026692 [Portunus trituberculatus]|uniref:Uncharacterized protein n=1 Tax=Portunus trituberculatus TaxID=210409 RepID=A0A5B7EJH1_PORTR|nr:hypothetical protein [Portunus trituberculatus]